MNNGRMSGRSERAGADSGSGRFGGLQESGLDLAAKEGPWAGSISRNQVRIPSHLNAWPGRRQHLVRAT